MQAIQDVYARFAEDFPALASILMFLVILACTYLVVHFGSKLVRRLLRKDGNPLPSSTIFVNIVRTFIWIAGAGIALRFCFGIDTGGILAALGVGGIALSLGFQDTLTNLIGGLQISLGKLVSPGDFVKVCGIDGKVCDVTWRDTTLVDSFNKMHVIPNSLMNSSELTKNPENHSIDIPFLMNPHKNLDALSDEIIERAGRAAEKVAEVRFVKVFYTGSEFGGIAGFIRVCVVRKELDEDEVTANAVMRAVDDLVNPNL